MQTKNDTSKPEDSPQQEAGEGCQKRLVRPLPMSMREQLRGRYGLEPSDGSKDAAIAKLSPAGMVREAVGWELGDPSWAARIAMFMRAAGAKPEDF